MGLTSAEAASRLRDVGENAVRPSRNRALHILLRQLRSPLLALLAGTALVSHLVGEHNDALIIATILLASIGMGFTNEFRAARAADDLRARLAHDCTVWRDGAPVRLPVTQLVPDDLVELRLGDIVPADAELLTGTSVECDESMLTGESFPVAKAPDGDRALRMGSIIRQGEGTARITATGARTAFGRIAEGLDITEPPTAFQRGLDAFAMLLVRVAAVLTAAILVINLVLGRPIIDAVLFSLAIAVGISPQLLPAVVSTSMTRGAHLLARKRVLVKRLVSIEDLGDIESLFTDKTGTLTEGEVALDHVIEDPDARRPVLAAAAQCTDVTTLATGEYLGNPLDVALLRAVTSPSAGVVVDRRPFSHELRTCAVILREEDGTFLRIEKGAPEALLDPASALNAASAREMAAGNRVIAVTTTPVTAPRIDADASAPAAPAGLLVFRDPPKADAASSLQRLAALGIDVHVVTGDAPEVAATLCAELGMAPGATLTGTDLATMSDAELGAAIPTTRVFARVSPEDKARIVRLHRASGHDVAFLGDGVNDALAIHEADVGISVDTAVDVARDAADVILLEKDLAVLADGVLEGRRIFANTTKYVLMGTSSNFGNMFSAAAASAFLPFLPMLPSQILLNNLLYDASQLAIPSDRVDPDLVERPAEWDIGHIRRYMLMIGPISSLFDFMTFAILLRMLHADATLFRTGWFIESLATQTLVVLAIRTARTPFWRSRPGTALLVAVLTVVALGALVPCTPLASTLGFTRPTGSFYATLVALVLVYIALVDRAKHWAGRAMSPP